MYSVYMHITPSNKVYIGITSKAPEERWMNGRGYQHNIHFYNAIEYYGWENIKHKILQSGLTKEEAENEEIRLIALYNATNPDKGYNCTHGGESIGKHTEETKQKISELRKRQYRTGELVHPMLGKHFTDESKYKMRKAHLGKKLTEEHKQKIGKSCKGLLAGSKNPMAVKVQCVDTGKVFNTVTEAAQSVGVCRVAVSRCVRGVSNTAGGYKWRYAV